jgi:hypothetical protein
MREVRLRGNRNRPISVVRVRHATDNAVQEKTYKQDKNQTEARIPDGSQSRHAYEKLFGSQGPASPVRKIDPTTGEVIVIIKHD